MPASRNDSQTADPATVAGLAEQREDAGTDHRANAEEGSAADAHRQATIWSSCGVLLKRCPPSAVTVTMSSIRTPKRP